MENESYLLITPKKKGGNEDPLGPYWKLESNKDMLVIRLTHSRDERKPSAIMSKSMLQNNLRKKMLY